MGKANNFFSYFQISFTVYANRRQTNDLVKKIMLNLAYSSRTDNDPKSKHNGHVENEIKQGTLHKES